MKCGRCAAAVTEKSAEYCWFCTGYLCYECWDMKGHCGHVEADLANARAFILGLAKTT